MPEQEGSASLHGALQAAANRAVDHDERNVKEMKQSAMPMEGSAEQPGMLLCQCSLSCQPVGGVNRSQGRVYPKGMVPPSRRHVMPWCSGMSHASHP